LLDHLVLNISCSERNLFYHRFFGVFTLYTRV